MDFLKHFLQSPLISSFPELQAMEEVYLLFEPMNEGPTMMEEVRIKEQELALIEVVL